MEEARPLRLRYTRLALADLDAILDYVRRESPADALRVVTRIQKVIDLLVLHPQIGHATDDPAIRRMTATPFPYFVFYEMTADEVIIHAVRHAARDPSSMPGSG